MRGVSDLAASASALLAENVALLDPEERVFEAMLAGWVRQQQARALRAETIRSRASIVTRMHVHTNSYPWQWTAADYVDFSAYLGSTVRVAYSTLRGYQISIRLFLEYITDSRYGWIAACTKRFGRAPEQLADEWNTTRHSAEFEARPGRRPLTFDEVQSLFDYLDDRVRAIRQHGKKGALAAFRDAVIFKVAYAYGLRRREVARLELPDLRHNPAVRQYGTIGAIHVRHGKGARGGPPRRRIVLTVPEFDWVVDTIVQYLEEVRPRFGAANHPGLFVTERLGFVAPVYIGTRFGEVVCEAGLDKELELHCLRHTYSTHLAEFGYDPLFIQEQLGHTYAASTAIYTHVSNDFKNQQIKRALSHLYSETGKRS